MNRIPLISVSVTLVLSILATSCVLGKSALPTDPHAQDRSPSLTQASPTQYLTKTSLDPTAAKYFDNTNKALSFNSDELTLLRQNGFVVTDRLAWDRFLDAYAWIYWKDLPVLVTTDSILHSVHQSYDNLLKDIERSLLMPKMSTILSQTEAQLARDRTANQFPDSGPTYDDVLTYVAVALALLNGEPPADAKAVQLYSLAVAADAVQTIDLFGSKRDVDFTLFKPRGHYATEPQFQQYFRAMNWLAQIDFRFVDFDPLTSKPVLHPSQIAAAAVLRSSIDSAGQRAAWNSVDGVLTSLVGGSDNTTLNDLDRFMKDMNLSGPGDVMKADSGQMLSRLLSSDYGYQRITGTIVYRDTGNFSTAPVPRPVSFMLMGQRFAIDSYVLGNVVYDRMMSNGKPILRPLPSSLDVMYALGNDRALTELGSELQKYNYQPQLADMRSEVDSLSAAFWKAPTYNEWLGLIRQLNGPTLSAKYPQSMRTAAWADKTLQTQLASWAQLRHDNVLYVKQSFTAVASCSYPEAYVEPYPEFYGSLHDLAQSGYNALLTVSDDPSSDWETHQKKAVLAYLNNVMSAATQLKNLAQKELAAQNFTPEETNWLKSVVIRQDGKGGGCGPAPYTWDGWYVKMFYGEDASPAVIVDVHTNPNNDPAMPALLPPAVLHAAVGAVAPIALVVDTDEGSVMYTGPTLSYYDVVETGFPPVRLTDQQWQARLDSQKQPQHPAWTKSFLTPSGAKPQMLHQ